jgi:peptide/nickel transport system substrate-binding protein
MRHEVDLVQFIDREDYEILKQDASFKTYMVTAGIYSAILYNLSDPILSDVDVRQAIARGIDRQKILNGLAEVGGVESTGPFHPDFTTGNSVGTISYDPVLAKMDLMHRGWKDADEDGILEKYGRKLEISLLVDTRNEMYKKIAKMIRQQLAQIGISIKVVLYDDENDLTEDYLLEHRTQAWLRFFSGPKGEEYQSLRDWYSYSNEVGRLWRYKNPQIDQLFQSAVLIQDENELKDIFHTVQEIIYKDQPACFLFFPTTLFAVNSGFQNTEAFFTMYMPVYTLKDWYVGNTEGR